MSLPILRDAMSVASSATTHGPSTESTYQPKRGRQGDGADSSGPLAIRGESYPHPDPRSVLPRAVARAKVAGTVVLGAVEDGKWQVAGSAGAYGLQNFADQM